MNIITIVTPSYNQGEFIEETIRSVLIQEGDFYIDYIIIDGASSDNSVSIIEKYETLLRENCRTGEYAGLKWYVRGEKNFRWNNCLGIRYRWLSEKDNGQVDALKKGFRLAGGDIYGWLNSDDIYIHPGVFRKVMAYFAAEPGLELLCGDGIFISKTGQETGIHRVAQINLKELLFLDYHILQPSSFFSKTIYHEKQLDEQYICAFDALFFIHHLSNGVLYKKVADRFSAFRYYEEIKTIALRKRKNREFLDIDRKYSNNIFFIAVSAFYRKAETLLHPFSNVKKGFKYKLFVLIRRLSYLLITGKWGRQG
ncbi:MAG TPA: glycosyltransferase [Candidatus Kapabacteria bacterium]|nr:glycosyltransferase [Candidatus Kapabacteria bacterium]